MNNKILCVYYSRSGKTKQAMQEIAEALDCEVVEIHDKVDRSGFFGWLRCGFDAMRKRTRPVEKPATQRNLGDYKLVIVATPVWAGRCSSVMRSFLKRRAYELQDVAYVITRASEEPYKSVFDQMDSFLDGRKRVAEVSLCLSSQGYHFWRDSFIKTVSDLYGEQ